MDRYSFIVEDLHLLLLAGLPGALRVDSELGTIVWPNGADLDPDVLYGLVTGRKVKLREPV